MPRQRTGDRRPSLTSSADAPIEAGSHKQRPRRHRIGTARRSNADTEPTIAFRPAAIVAFPAARLKA